MKKIIIIDILIIKNILIKKHIKQIYFNYNIFILFYLNKIFHEKIHIQIIIPIINIFINSNIYFTSLKEILVKLNLSVSQFNFIISLLYLPNESFKELSLFNLKVFEFLMFAFLCK